MDDDNEFRPRPVGPRAFEELPPLMVGCGTQHVVVLSSDNKERAELPTFELGVLNFAINEEEEKLS